MNAIPAGVNGIFAGMNAIPAGVNGIFAGVDAIPAGVNGIFAGVNAIPAGMNGIFAGVNGSLAGMKAMPPGGRYNSGSTDPAQVQAGEKAEGGRPRAGGWINESALICVHPRLHSCR